MTFARYLVPKVHGFHIDLISVKIDSKGNNEWKHSHGGGAHYIHSVSYSLWCFTSLIGSFPGETFSPFGNIGQLFTPLENAIISLKCFYEVSWQKY